MSASLAQPRSLDWYRRIGTSRHWPTTSVERSNLLLHTRRPARTDSLSLVDSSAHRRGEPLKSWAALTPLSSGTDNSQQEPRAGPSSPLLGNDDLRARKPSATSLNHDTQQRDERDRNAKHLRNRTGRKPNPERSQNLHNHEHERWPDQAHAPNNHQDPEFRPTTKPRVRNEERKTQADDRRQRRENTQQPHRWPHSSAPHSRIKKDREVLLDDTSPHVRASQGKPNANLPCHNCTGLNETQRSNQLLRTHSNRQDRQPLKKATRRQRKIVASQVQHRQLRELGI
jgi:hypothetical protein